MNPERDDEAFSAVEIVGWQPKAWAKAAGVGTTTTFKLLKTKAIEARKLGNKLTIITTSPAEYLASLPRR